MGAWSKQRVGDLNNNTEESIVNSLSTASAERNLEPNKESVQAWRITVDIIRKAADYWMLHCAGAADWTVLFEYEVPRRSKRVDVIVLARDLIMLMEFKVGSDRFDRNAQWQTEQYALDLRDFHKVSRDRTIVPFLIATEAVSSDPSTLRRGTNKSNVVHCVSQAELATRAAFTYERLTDGTSPPIDVADWDASPYQPTPWIVRAAQDIFQNHDVSEIKLADSHNLDSTVDSVFELVEFCKSNGRHGISFITGAPGSGKTLAGLQVIHHQRLVGDQDSAGVFLSGNRPLVEVIRKALSIDATRREAGENAKEMERRIETFIQHAYAFRTEYLENPTRRPHEHIILFDEAQRAWDSDQVRRWTKGAINKSEPELFLEFMSRFSDWSVIIAVVGSGQEINRGEAGLSEWGRAIENSTSDWVIKASPQVLSERSDLPGGDLFDPIPSSAQVQQDGRLHLTMNVRSPGLKNLTNGWIRS